MIELSIEILTSIILLVGVFFALAGAIGLVRFPDVYCRLHAAGLTTSLGVPIVLLAALVYFSLESRTLSLKALLALVFIMLTSPVGTHMIGWSAFRTGVPMTKGSDAREMEELTSSTQRG